MRSRTPTFGAMALFTQLALVTGCFDPIPAGTLRARSGAIAGKVRHFCSGKALADVAVTAYRVVDGRPDFTRAHGPSTSGSDGAFLIDGLEPGTWQVNITRGSFATALRVVRVYETERHWVEQTLAPSFDPTPAVTKLDVLFVIDNSDSMREEQQALSKAFPAFIKALDTALKNQILDLHLGVISTDLGAGNYKTVPSCGRIGGDGGRLLHLPRKTGCATPTNPYLAAASGQQNFKGTIDSAFSCIAELGTQGCGFEQPLAAALKALEPKTNPGFSRPDAALAVIVLTDEDDCSAHDPSLYNPKSEKLGPPTSFRCFHYGFLCDVNDWNIPGPRKDCKPYYTFLLDLDEVVKKLRQGRDKREVFFAAISGRADRVEVVMRNGLPELKPSCVSTVGTAQPALRLKALADKLQPYSYFNTLCSGDLGLKLSNLATEIALKAIFNPCKQ
jgi:hypothetical protein